MFLLVSDDHEATFAQNVTMATVDRFLRHRVKIERVAHIIYEFIINSPNTNINTKTFFYLFILILTSVC